MIDTLKISSKVSFQDIEVALMDDIDARLWFDDLLERVIQGRFPSRTWEAHENDRAQEEFDIQQQGYDEGYAQGYEEGEYEGEQNAECDCE